MTANRFRTVGVFGGSEGIWYRCRQKKATTATTTTTTTTTTALVKPPQGSTLGRSTKDSHKDDDHHEDAPLSPVDVSSQRQQNKQQQEAQQGNHHHRLIIPRQQQPQPEQQQQPQRTPPWLCSEWSSANNINKSSSLRQRKRHHRLHKSYGQRKRPNLQQLLALHGLDTAAAPAIGHEFDKKNDLNNNTDSEANEDINNEQDDGDNHPMQKPHSSNCIQHRSLYHGDHCAVSSIEKLVCLSQAGQHVVKSQSIKNTSLASSGANRDLTKSTPSAPAAASARIDTSARSSQTKRPPVASAPRQQLPRRSQRALPPTRQSRSQKKRALLPQQIPGQQKEEQFKSTASQFSVTVPQPNSLTNLEQAREFFQILDQQQSLTIESSKNNDSTATGWHPIVHRTTSSCRKRTWFHHPDSVEFHTDYHLHVQASQHAQVKPLSWQQFVHHRNVFVRCAGTNRKTSSTLDQLFADE